MEGDEKYQTTYHERDQETGFDFRGARYYDSEVGRFLSTDPLAAQRSWLTPYNYVQNNPVMRTDPTGALDDNYSVDSDGKVRLEESTDDNYDVVYSKSDWDNGNLENGVTIKDTTILSELKKIEYGGTNQWDTKSIAIS